MKAIRKKDGKVIEVSSLEYTDIETNVKSRYCAADGEMYPLSDLDFSVGEAKESESDLRISVAKLREILEQVLDFSNEGRSIFDREKPLSEKTLERIYAGLIKFVAGGKNAFMIKYNSVNQKTGKYVPPSLDAPCPTVATQNRLALAQVSFLSKQYGGHPYSKNVSVDGPAGTVTAIDHHVFVSVQYGNGYNIPTNRPAPTITTKDKLSLVTTRFIANEYSGGGQLSSIDTVNPAVLTNPKQKLVTVCPWIMDTNFGNVGASVDVPSRVITANHKQHYLMNPQFASPGSSVDDPCFTLIARMDKRPPYLIVTESGNVAIRIFETDSPMMVRIKEFMALYGIIDIKMRMLMIDELKLIMGFPEDYVLIGTQAEQKKFIGNAVEVTIARKLCEVLCSGLRDFDLNKYNSKQTA